MAELFAAEHVGAVAVIAVVTALLVTAAKLIAAGATELEAAEVCIVTPLTNDGAITHGLRELVAASLLAETRKGVRA